MVWLTLENHGVAVLEEGAGNAIVELKGLGALPGELKKRAKGILGLENEWL